MGYEPSRLRTHEWGDGAGEGVTDEVELVATGYRFYLMLSEDL